jgi:hypothetical protein
MDPWFQDVCYVGGVPYAGPNGANDWTRGWTYFAYDGGATRTDIDTNKPTATITGFITSDTTWTNDTNIVLNGRVGVDSTYTLTVQAGTVVLGAGPGSYLVIERGADLVANGTEDAPIIFTSGAPLGDQQPGDWGGVVIHGEAVANCAPVRNVSGNGGCGLTDLVNECTSEGGAGVFGRNNDDDSSGSIRYARVEYAGQEISINNELNAWTFNAVGRNTTIEFLQAHLGTDDMFEWFGGTARCRYLVASGGDDDNLDWQMGFRGFVQFAVCSQAPDAVTANADAGIEADNNEFNFDCEGRSAPKLSNLTLIGDVGAGRGMRLRRGTGFKIINSIVQGFGSVGLRVENDETFSNCPGTAYSDLNCNQLAVGDPVLGNRFIAAAAPNPTAAAANISFALPETGDVKVQIFDVNGRLVSTVLNQTMEAGDHSVRWDAAAENAGIYFYSVVTNGEKATGKIVVSR